jgi:hypothetical protein
MILLAALLVAVLIGLFSGGRLGRLGALNLRFAWMALLGFGMQIYMIYWPSATAPAFLSLHTALLVSSYLILLAFVWINRRLMGMFVVGLGLLMNLSVMLANGGYMPITPEAVVRVGHEYELQTFEPGARLRNTKDVMLPREQTNLWFLSDIFAVPRPFPIPSVFSPGDAVLALGAAILIIAGMHHRDETQAKPAP